MKNLYRRLGIVVGSTEMQVAAALSSNKGLAPEDGSCVRGVLLNPDRKRQYDRIHKTAEELALLRSALGMSDGTLRHIGFYREFADTSPVDERSSKAAVDPKTSASDGTELSTAFSIILSISFAIISSLTVMIFVYFTFEKYPLPLPTQKVATHTSAPQHRAPSADAQADENGLRPVDFDDPASPFFIPPDQEYTDTSPQHRAPSVAAQADENGLRRYSWQDSIPLAENRYPATTRYQHIDKTRVRNFTGYEDDRIPSQGFLPMDEPAPRAPSAAVQAKTGEYTPIDFDDPASPFFIPPDREYVDTTAQPAPDGGYGTLLSMGAKRLAQSALGIADLLGADVANMQEAIARAVEADYRSLSPEQRRRVDAKWFSIDFDDPSSPFYIPPGQGYTGTTAQPAPPFNQSEQPLPSTGLFDIGRSDTENAITVKTMGDRNTLVKIEKPSGEEVTRGFIRAGETHTFKLPRGTYILKTAAGQKWYGEEHFFGPDTTYSQADDTFLLNERGDHWTVELTPQVSGNLGEAKLRADQF